MDENQTNARFLLNILKWVQQLNPPKGFHVWIFVEILTDFTMVKINYRNILKENLKTMIYDLILNFQIVK